ncbi:MAG TPA: hypothetical protein VLC46_16290 [Thermoanaerobaculia bacterium]|nr:hypothetical protein [Thermoanaerobaculia bacterium]
MKMLRAARQVAGIRGMTVSAARIGRTTAYDATMLVARSAAVCGATVSDV